MLWNKTFNWRQGKLTNCQVTQNREASSSSPVCGEDRELLTSYKDIVRWWMWCGYGLRGGAGCLPCGRLGVHSLNFLKSAYQSKILKRTLFPIRVRECETMLDSKKLKKALQAFRVVQKFINLLTDLLGGFLWAHWHPFLWGGKLWGKGMTGLSLGMRSRR